MTIDGRKGERHGRLRQPVAGYVALRPETVRRKPVGKALQGVRQHGFPCIDGHSPGTEVQAFKGAVRNLARTEFVGEVGSGTERTARIVHGPEPAFGSAEESKR